LTAENPDVHQVPAGKRLAAEYRDSAKGTLEKRRAGRGKGSTDLTIGCGITP